MAEKRPIESIVAGRSRSGMARRQRGMTTLGLLILVAFGGLFVYAGIRLVPVYLEHMKIVRTLEGIKSEFDGEGATREMITKALNRRLYIESVRVINENDVKLRRIQNGYSVEAAYENRTPFIANISFVVSFDKKVEVRR